MGKRDWRIGLNVKTKYRGDRWQGITGEIVEVMETGSCGLIDSNGIIVVRLGNGETIVSGADRWMTASGN